MSEQEEMVRDGQRAAAILDDPVFAKAVARVEAKWTGAWRREQDAVKREGLWAKLAALEEVQTELQAIKNNGEMERHNSRRISSR